MGSWCGYVGKLDNKLIMTGYKLKEDKNGVRVYSNKQSSKLVIVDKNETILTKNLDDSLLLIKRTKFQLRIKSVLSDTREDINIVVTSDGKVYDLGKEEEVGETENLILMYCDGFIGSFNKKTGVKKKIRIYMEQGVFGKPASISIPDMSRDLIEVTNDIVIIKNMYLNFQTGVSMYIHRGSCYTDMLLLNNDMLTMYKHGKKMNVIRVGTMNWMYNGDCIKFIIDLKDGEVYHVRKVVDEKNKYVELELSLPPSKETIVKEYCIENQVRILN